MVSILTSQIYVIKIQTGDTLLVLAIEPGSLSLL